VRVWLPCETFVACELPGKFKAPCLWWGGAPTLSAVLAAETPAHTTQRAANPGSGTITRNLYDPTPDDAKRRRTRRTPLDTQPSLDDPDSARDYNHGWRRPRSIRPVLRQEEDWYVAPTRWGERGVMKRREREREARARGIGWIQEPGFRGQDGNISEEKNASLLTMLIHF
jgi:hypothetical protein